MPARLMLLHPLFAAASVTGRALKKEVLT